MKLLGKCLDEVWCWTHRHIVNLWRVNVPRFARNKITSHIWICMQIVLLGVEFIFDMVWVHLLIKLWSKHENEYRSDKTSSFPPSARFLVFQSLWVSFSGVSLSCSGKCSFLRVLYLFVLCIILVLLVQNRIKFQIKCFSPLHSEKGSAHKNVDFILNSLWQKNWKNFFTHL